MRRALAAVRPTALAVAVLALVGWAVAGWVEARHGVALAPGSFRFERPWAGLLLLAAPLVLAARGHLLRGAAPRLRVSRGHDLASLDGGWRRGLRDLPTALRVGAVALLALGLMGPQSIYARDRAEIEGIDIVLALDLSLSMQAADITPTRFEATKDVVVDFVRRRPNDRIGAVVFGRDAYTLLPLTTDRAALVQTIDGLELGTIDGRGTAIGNALGTALNRLRDSSAESRVVILLTDGDSNSGNISPDQAAVFAETLGVQVFPVLMGRSDQARTQSGRDLFGRPIWDVGSFPINPELLGRMARLTGGEYFEVTDREALERSFHAILDRLEKSEIEDPGRVYGELFPAFVGPALLLLLVEILVGALVLRRVP